MKLFAGLVLSGIIAVAANTTANAAPSFNCKYAKLAAEKVICGNSYLQQLDRQLASLYRFALANPYGYSLKKLKREQRAWLAERNACGWDADCIALAYNERNEFLETFGD